MTHLPDQASANQLAQALLQERLAACVNIQSPCTSIYHWQGRIETAAEIPVQIKTLLAHYPEVESQIKALHPYELPEIVYVHVDGGEQAFIQWIYQETRD